MSVKKEQRCIHFRPMEGDLAKLTDIAIKRGAAVGKLVTISDVVRLCIDYGLPVVIAELNNPTIVNVAQKSHTDLVREMAISALDSSIKTLKIHQHADKSM